VLPAGWSYLLPFHTRAHSVNFLMAPPYHPLVQRAQLQQQTSVQAQPASLPYAMDLDLHSVMATELLEEAAKDSGLSDSSGSNYCEGRSHSGSHQLEAKNEQVLRRVQELQHLVQTSEQYLSEQEQGGGGVGGGGGVAMLEFDSDCDSLNSSKVSERASSASSW